jgi:hypothetical protein
MRIEERKLYQFDELEEKAQRKALDYYMTDYPWGDENRESLDAFCNCFSVKVKDWDIERGFISWEFKGEPWAERAGIRLYNWLMYHHFDTLYPMEYKEGKRKREWRRFPANSGGGVFTGYCMDDTLLDPIMNFLKKPTEGKDWEGLINDCLYTWVFAYREEIEYTYTDEFKKEQIEANNYEFLENGTMV